MDVFSIISSVIKKPAAKTAAPTEKNAGKVFQSKISRLAKSKKPVREIVDEVRSLVIEVLNAKESHTNQELITHLNAQKQIPQAVKDDFIDLINTLDASEYGQHNGDEKKQIISKATIAFENIADN